MNFDEEFNCWNNSLPVCPYCGEEDEQGFDIVYHLEGDSTTHTCKKCDEDYLVIVEITPRFTTRKRGKTNEK